MTSLTDMPADIVEAARDVARGIYLNVDEDGRPYMTRDDIEVVARAILAERQKWTMAEGVDVQRLPIGTPVEKVGGYPFPGTVVSAFHTLAGNERFVVEATGSDYSGMLHIFNGGQLRELPKGGA